MSSIVIRELSKQDVADHVILANDPDIQKLSLFQGAKKRGENLDEVFNKLADLNEKKHRYCTYSVLDGDILVGGLSVLYPEKDSSDPVHIGVWTGNDFRGKRYGVKAVNAIIAQIKETCPGSAIRFSIRNDNQASFALFKKVSHDYAIQTVSELSPDFSYFDIV